MIAWPDDLVSDIARRRCVLFLGAGISRNSVTPTGRSPKTWIEFLNYAITKLSPTPRYLKKLLKDGDLLTVCELVKMNLGRDVFNSIVIEEYLSPGYKPAEIHDTIFKLDSRIVATPNFDKIYETHANHKAGGSIRIKHQYDTDVVEAIRRSDRLVLKVHGTIDSPNNMVFTRAEYAEARSRYQTFYSVFNALVLSNTFLFLGCGITDPDIRLLLEDSFFRHTNARPHIFVLPSKALHDDVAKVVEATMNVKILTYNAVDLHVQLKASLDTLVERVELERLALQSNTNW